MGVKKTPLIISLPVILCLITVCVFAQRNPDKSVAGKSAKSAARWHWWNGNLYEQQTPKAGIHLNVLPPFRQQSPEEFVTYYITMGMPLRVKFEFADNGKARAMMIATPNGYVKALRLST